MSGAAAAALIAALTPPYGGNDDKTSLLLPGGYVPGTFNFQDLSPQTRSITPGGVTSVSGSSSSLRPNHLVFPGTSGGYLALAPHASTNFGAGAFCIDFWVYFNSLAANRMLFCQRPNNSATISLLIGVNTTPRFFAYATSNNTTWTILDGVLFGTPVTGQWMHVALYRIGNNFYGAVNGVPTLLGTSALAIADSAYNTLIGGDINTNYLNGNFSEYRISKGASRFPSSNFTPPARPYT